MEHSVPVVWAPHTHTHVEDEISRRKTLNKQKFEENSHYFKDVTIDYQRPHRELHKHKSCVINCYITENPAHIITAEVNGTIIIWNPDNGKSKYVMTAPKPVTSMYVIRHKADHLIMTSLSDGRLYVWRLGPDKAEFAAEFTAHLPNPIYAICANSDNTLLATGCCFEMFQIDTMLTPAGAITYRGTLKLWDLTHIINISLKPETSMHDKTPLQMKTVAQLGGSNLDRKTRYHRGGPQGDHPEDEDKAYGIRSLVFVDSDQKLVVGLGHPGIDIHDRSTKLIIVCCAKTLNKLWSESEKTSHVTSLATIPRLTNHWDLIYCTHAQIKRVGMRCSSNKHMRIKTDEQWATDECDTYQTIAISHNYRIVAVAQNSSIQILDSLTGDVCETYIGHSCTVSSLCFSATSHALCSTDISGGVRVWQVHPRWYTARLVNGKNGKRS